MDAHDPGEGAATTRGRAGGAPIGRRLILGLLGVGGLGVVGGRSAQQALSGLLAPVQTRDPTGLSGLIPLGDTFRYYSVTGSVPHATAATYRLTVSGLVAHPAAYSLADLQSMPQTSLVRDFQCVTGWRVPQVHWTGVRVADLLDLAGPGPTAAALRIRSFDRTYVESLTLEQARASDVLVALQMLGAPVTHEHGGPVRMYVASMYGYKSTKWLSSIEVVDRVQPGYWETRGYDVDALIDRSNGR
jgi:DMSO/TMAO reductase YedYZ molybdopterin-dependent catalytic subunit